MSGGGMRGWPAPMLGILCIIVLGAAPAICASKVLSESFCCWYEYSYSYACRCEGRVRDINTSGCTRAVARTRLRAPYVSLTYA
eukprot:scaffold336237_cov49-Prasinocladus_malaysianus.AAC.2